MGARESIDLISPTSVTFLIKFEFSVFFVFKKQETLKWITRYKSEWLRLGEPLLFAIYCK